jgi:hypothetical protein
MACASHTVCATACAKRLLQQAEDFVSKPLIPKSVVCGSVIQRNLNSDLHLFVIADMQSKGIKCSSRR